MPFDVHALLQSLPLLIGSQNPAALEGYQRYKAEQLAKQKADQAAQYQQAQIQNLQADNARADQTAALERLSLAQKALAPWASSLGETATDPAQAQQQLTQQAGTLEQAYKIPTGQLSAMMPPLAPVISARKKKKAAELYAQAEKQFGPEAMAGDSITLKSAEFGDVKPSALRAMFSAPAVDVQGKPAPLDLGKKTPPVPGSFEDYVTAPPARQAQITAARKTYTEAGRAEPSVNINMGASDTTDMAQQLVSGDLVPSQLSKRTTNYNAILAQANRASKEQTGKPYNAAQAQIQYEAARRFAGSLNSQQMVRFQGLGHSVVNTIDEVRRLGEQMHNSGIQLANRLQMEAYMQANGNSERGQLVAQYLGAVNTLKEEFANLVNGGMAPTEAAFNLANQQINANYGEKALNASLTEVQRLINFRLNSFSELQPLGGPGVNPQARPVPTTSGADPLAILEQRRRGRGGP